MRPITFFRTLFNTITSPKYYIDVLNVRFWFTVRFLVMSYVLLTFLATALFVILDIPKIEKSLTTYINQEVAEFPADYKITWNGLQLSTNFTETYTLPFPALPDMQDAPPLLLQLHPDVTSAEQIQSHAKKASFFFVGQNQAFISQPGGKWSTLPLSDLFGTSSFELTKESVQKNQSSYVQSTQAAIKVLPLIFPAFFFFLSFPFRLLNVLLNTLLIFLCVKLLGFPLTFKKTLQLSLHVMIAAELITILTAGFSVDLPMFDIAFWGYTAIVYWNLRHIQALPIDALLRQEKDHQ